MNPFLCDAIERKEIIQFRYGGKLRVAEPHLYGWNAESRREILSVYQIGGESGSSPLPAWRTFYAARITDLSGTGLYFKTPRSGFNPEDPVISILYCAAEAVS